MFGSFCNPAQEEENLPKSMSSMAAFAPSTSTLLPSLSDVCRYETESRTNGLNRSAYSRYLCNGGKKQRSNTSPSDVIFLRRPTGPAQGPGQTSRLTEEDERVANLYLPCEFRIYVHREIGIQSFVHCYQCLKPDIPSSNPHAQEGGDDPAQWIPRERKRYDWVRKE